MSQQLPALPNLDYLKKQAKGVLRVARHRRQAWRLADAQHAIARGYGFPGWGDLKRHIESARRDDAAPAPSHSQKDDIAPSANERPPFIPIRPNATHPMVGTWAQRPILETGDHHASVDAALLEIELADDNLMLTQIAADATGRDSAVRMAIKIDGLHHRIQFGKDLTLQARWINVQTLETILMHGAQIVVRGTYEVTPDGQSLVISTPPSRLVFERV